MTVTVRPADPRDPQATRLLTASHALMEALFPAESNHFLSIDELARPGIHFFAAYEDDTLLGCGALAERDGYGEVKSMFTAPEGRGQGIASLVLDAIEAKAREIGLPCLRLETGDLLYEAHRLYARHGFDLRGPFGDYVDDPRSLFMEKPLI